MAGMPAAARRGKVDLAVAHHHRAVRPAAGHLDGAGQMAWRRFANGERVAAGDGAEARGETERLQQRLGQAFELVGAHASRAPRREQMVQQLRDAVERPAADRNIVGVEGEEMLVQALELLPAER